jgi:CubicO group peptidase (beta-lactamase class C family)
LNTYRGPPYCAAVAAGDPVWPVAELLARVKADRLVFSPGEGWAYSNVGYLFVRQLIEETVDMENDESLRALVFEPMGHSAHADRQDARRHGADLLGQSKWLRSEVGLS